MKLRRLNGFGAKLRGGRTLRSQHSASATATHLSPRKPTMRASVPLARAKGVRLRRFRGGLWLVTLVFLFARVSTLAAGYAALDLNAWMKERPRIRELVARWSYADGRVRYLLLVADGSNYVVKIAPSEKLLRARVLTPDISASGRCGDEFWVAKGKIQELRFLREHDLHSKETNYTRLTRTLNHGVAKLGLAFLRFGTEPLREEEELRLTPGGFESKGGGLTKTIAIENVRDAAVGRTYSLTATVIGDSVVGGVSRFQVRGTLESDSFIPLNFSIYYPDSPSVPAVTVHRLSLKLGSSSIPLRLFRPELYVLEGFHTVMRMQGDQVVAFSAGDPSWRKVIIFGWVLPYRVVKWTVIVLIAVITVIAVVCIRKQKTTTKVAI